MALAKNNVIIGSRFFKFGMVFEYNFI